MKILFIFSLLFFLFSCDSNQNNNKAKNSCKKNGDCDSYFFCVDEKCKDYSNNNFSSIKELSSLSIYNFIIMSDNKGDALEDKRFKNMVDWSSELKSSFIIGLGDHLKINWENSFLDFLVENKFWFENFYPGIADGENEYYGNSQGDWGAGKKFLELLNFDKKENTTVRDNGVEYYSTFKVGDLNIHLIQLHFPDTPSDPSIAWPQNSRDFLIKTLKSIGKTKNDLIIVGAHSINGRWYQYLNEEEFKLVMDKVDLGLSATSHIFGRYKIDGYRDYGTLFLNTGAISRPRLTNGEGYIHVFILDNPKRILLEYVDPRKDKIEFDTRYPLFIKNIGGLIYEKIIKN